MLYRLMSISEYVQMNHNTLPINTTIWSKHHESSSIGYCLFDDKIVPPSLALQMLHYKYSIIVYFSDDKINLKQSHGVYHLERDQEIFVKEYCTKNLCALHPVKAHRILFGNKVQEEVNLYGA